VFRSRLLLCALLLAAAPVSFPATNEAPTESAVHARLAQVLASPAKTVLRPGPSPRPEDSHGLADEHSNCWGNRETTVHFRVSAPAQAVPAFYYRIFDQPMTLAGPAIEAWLRLETGSKAHQRISGGFANYKIRADSLTLRTIGGRRAVGRPDRVAIIRP